MFEARVEALRREVDEASGIARDARERLRTVLKEQRTGLDAARRERDDATRDLRLEVRMRLDEVTDATRRAFEAEGGKHAAVAAEVAELRGTVAAFRDEKTRFDVAQRQAQQRFMEETRGAAAAAKEASKNIGREAAARFDDAAKVIERFGREIDDLRRSQAAVNAKVDGELDAGRRAVARCAEAVGRADAVAATVEESTLERLRLELRTLEQRLAADVARVRGELRDERSNRERAVDELSQETHIIGERVQDRLIACEGICQSVHQSSQAARQQHDDDCCDLVVCCDDGGGPLDHHPRGSGATSPTGGGGKNTKTPQTALPELEARLSTRVAELAKDATVETAAAQDRLRTDQEKLRSMVHAEAEARKKLESSVAGAIEAAVATVARAARKEVHDLKANVADLDAKMDDEAQRSSDELGRALAELREKLKQSDQKHHTGLGKLKHDMLEIKRSSYLADEKERTDREIAIDDISRQCRDAVERSTSKAKDDVVRSLLVTDERQKAALEKSRRDFEVRFCVQDVVEAVVATTRVSDQRDADDAVRASERALDAQRQRIALRDACTKLDVEHIQRITDVKLYAERTIDDRTQAIVTECLRNQGDKAEDIAVSIDRADAKQASDAAIAADAVTRAIAVAVKPLADAVNDLTARLDRQDILVAKLQTDIVAAVDQSQGNHALGFERSQALAVAARTQLVNGLRHLVKSTSKYTVDHVEEAFTPLHADANRERKALKALTKRVDAIEQASDPTAWGDSIRQAAAAMSHLGLGGLPSPRNSYGDDLLAAGGASLLEGHVRPAFHTAATPDLGEVTGTAS